MIEFKFSVPSRSSPALETAWDRLFQNKDARFFDLPGRSSLWAASLARSLEIQKGYDVTCVIGIGGSSLGGRALLQAFSGLSPHRVRFFEAPDETAVRGWQSDLGPLSRVHFVLISKSGKTLETLALLDYWTQILKDAGLEIGKQATVICGEGKSPLRDWALAFAVPILPVPEDVGGRFSVLTPVGLLPSALIGVPLERMRAGAEWALGQKAAILQLAAAALRDFQQEKWITQMWVYSGAFHTLGLWWQQLWSESLGKKSLRAGGAASRVSTPMVCQGPQDQHSLMQQLQEGASDKAVIIFRDHDAEKSNFGFTCLALENLEPRFKTIHLGDILKAEVEGFQGALAAAAIPHFTITASSSHPESWGAFFMVWELVVGVLGEHLAINAFDQPGVELGKRLALESLRRRL